MKFIFTLSTALVLAGRALAEYPEQHPVQTNAAPAKSAFTIANLVAWELGAQQ